MDIRRFKVGRALRRNCRAAKLTSKITENPKVFGVCPRNFNTPSGRRDARADDCRIRQAAIKYSVPYLTTLAAAAAAAEGIAAAMKGQGEVRSLQEYHANVS
ncbi:MAG: hypothetical protein IJV91_05105 [Kiritimatiellae bacterium]|nr:hypothetical protein [Kiritimatiellia bacterium]